MRSPNEILASFYSLLGRVVLIPVPKGEKRAILKGWPSITYQATQKPAYQKVLLDCIGRGGNIGGVLGPESEDLHTVDIDDDELAELFLSDNPAFAKSFRSQGRRGCQFWCRPAPGTGYANTKAVYKLKSAEGNIYGEWRCGGGDKGAQSVFFGLHPEGNNYRILIEAPPIEIDFASIKWLGPPPADEAQREKRKLKGQSIISYAERKIDESKNLLGTRWLSRLCGGFIVAPSGHGKSSLVIQAAICWSCGRLAFGIKPSMPLRILIVESEDDDNDVTEMAQMCNRLELTADEKELVSKNTHIEWLNDVTGTEFFVVLDDFLSQFLADLVFINPYTAFQGGDIQDDELNNKFLRVELSRILNTHQCGAIPIHHTPKTNFQNTDKYSWFDWMYTMAGGATLTNWARSILVIAPTDLPGTYRFIAAKRFEKIGWQEREYWYAHSVEDGKILWVPASQDQIASGKKGKNATPQELLTLVPVLEPAPIEKLIVDGKQKLALGEKKVRHFLKVLLEEKKAFEHSFFRSGTRPEIRYAKTVQTAQENQTT